MKRTWRSLVALVFLAAPSLINGAEAPEDARAPLPRAFGEPRSVQVAGAFGAVSDSIVLEVSPGRRAVEPRLQLSFSSLAGGGILGQGWSLDLGKVERWRGDGTPTAVESEAYAYALASTGGELRHVGGGLYRARIESIYREFRRAGDGWRMFDGEGNLHRFGGTPESRVDGELWLLDLVQDPRGNTITYSYLRNGAALYPSEIRYTGYAPDGDLGANRVAFEYEARPDERIALNNGVREERSLRLRRISVFASGQLARRYEFSYTQSPLNGQSLLAGVTLVGADDLTRVVLRTLAYRFRELGWTEVSAAAFPGDLADAEGKDTGLRLADVNGDGFADVVRAGDWLGGGADVWLGDGEGGFTRDATWSASLAAAGVRFADGDGRDTGVRLVDVDSDLRPDLLIANPSRREVRLNTGAGWVPHPGWSASLEALESLARCYADPEFGGWPADCTPPHCGGPLGDFDGCTPPHCAGDQSDPPDCSPPDCTGASSDPPDCLPAECRATVDYSEPYVEPFALVDSLGDFTGVQLTDVNADGRLDIVWSMSRSQNLLWLLKRTPVIVRGVFFNTGAGWELSDLLTDALWDFPGEFATDSQLQGWDVLDINGDALADLVRTIGGAAREAHLGNGRGWEADAVFTGALEDAAITSLSEERRAQGLMPTDFNDDGLIDYLQAGGDEAQAWQGNGRGWIAAPSMASFLGSNEISFSDGEGKATGVGTPDIDGDGISDFVIAKAGSRRLWLSSTLRDGLLLSVGSAIGEVTELTWGLSIDVDNRQADGVQGLPIPTPIVRELTRSDGRGNSWTHAYDYGGGLFIGNSFRGFARSTHVIPNGLRVEQAYHQEEALAGQFSLEEGFDPQGRVRTRRRTTYELVPSTPPVQQARILRSEEESIDPGGSRRSATVYAYDDRLNRVAVLKDPDLDVQGDEVTMVLLPTSDEGRGLWSLPARVQEYLADGTLASETVIHYDGLPEGRVAQGLPTTVRERLAAGEYVERRMEYDLHGNVVRVEDREGQATLFAYEDPTATFRTRATDPEGREVRSQHDPRFGVPVRERDAAGGWTAKAYDALGRLARLVLPGDEASPAGTRTIEWSAPGDPGAQYYRVAETETPGRLETLDTVFRYDGLGMIWRTEREGPAGVAILAVSAFDETGNALGATRPYFAGDDPLWTRIERDVLRRPVRIREPDGVPFVLTHAGPGLTVVDRRGASSTFIRNGEGKITEVRRTVWGTEEVTSYRYDGLGRLREIVDAIGERTVISYDGLGRRTALDDPNSGTWRYAHDREGRIVAQTAPGGEVTRFVYNRAGDLLRKEFPDRSRVLFEYGAPGEERAAGRLVRVQDAAGTLEIGYDARGRVAKRRRTLAGGHAYLTGYVRDSLDRLRRQTYPDGFTAVIQYDTAGRLATVADGAGRLIAAGRAYTAAGQLAEFDFGNGATATFDYTDMLRMASIDTDTADGRALQDLDYSYDPGGNVTALSDGVTGTIQQFSYDEAGRLISALGPYGEERYDYDAAGNLLRKGSRVFAMDPDHPQRVVCAADLAYDPGWPHGIAHNPHAALCSSALSEVGAASARPKGPRNPVPGTSGNPNIARAFGVAYDARGNVVARAGTRFEYDAESRLVRVREVNGRLVEENVYDAFGQLVIRRAGGETTIHIDGIYEEGRTHASRHISAGPMPIATVVTPRAEVRLIESLPPSPFEEGSTGGLLRDALDRSAAAGMVALALSLVFVAPAARRRALRYALDVARSVAEQPFRASASLLLVPLLLLQATQAAGGEIVIARKMQASPGGSEQRFYYHANHLGSVNVVTDDRGAVIARRDYKPYGELFAWEGARSGPRELLQAFNGQRLDDRTGLYGFGVRQYDPEIGRFLSADTEVPDPMDPRRLNRYGFAAGNPIRYVDPTGHDFWDVMLGVVVVVVLVAAAVLCAVFLVGAVAFVLSLAFLGATAFAVGALSRGLSPLSADFWKATAFGFLLGAVIGAGLWALWYSAGYYLAGEAIAWYTEMLLAGLMGAGIGALEELIVGVHSHATPEDMLLPLLKGVVVGFVFGAIVGAVASRSLLVKGLDVALTVISIDFAILTGKQLLNIWASPPKGIGVPAWAFSGTVFGEATGEDRGGYAPLLRTMPLAL